MRITRAYERFAKARDAFRVASRAVANDRNQRAGDVYEAQQALNRAVEDLVTEEYAASWIERWQA